MPNVPKVMLTGTAAREDSTSSTSFVELVPTPGEVFNTQQVATLTGLFVTECRVATAGARLEVEIMVDKNPANPGVVVLSTETAYSTHSHLAFKTDVQPGQHKVTVFWRSSQGVVFVRNRSLTVWVSA